MTSNAVYVLHQNVNFLKSVDYNSLAGAVALMEPNENDIVVTRHS
jgi:hypothetical protein